MHTQNHIPNSFSPYSFNGMEHDNEIKGKGNSYTTFFRQNDPRLGRWLSPDPVFQPQQSPYCSMNNNPILLNDAMGDIVDGDKKGKRDFKKAERIANRNTNKYERKINRLQKKGEQVSQTLKDLGSAWRQTVDEINSLKASSTVYFINSRYNSGGSTMGYLGYSLNDEVVTVNYNKLGEDGYGGIDLLMHEMKHAYQYEKGQIAVNAGSSDISSVTGSGGSGLTDYYDLSDEMEAYNRQELYKSGTVKSMSINDVQLESYKREGLVYSPSTTVSSELVIRRRTELGFSQVIHGRSSDWANYRYKGFEADQVKAMDSMLKYKLGNDYEVIFKTLAR